MLEPHTSTITSVKFNQVHKLNKNDLQQEVTLLSASVDKSLSTQQLDLAKVKECKSMEELQAEEIFKESRTDFMKNKIFSMDVAE